MNPLSPLMLLPLVSILARIKTNYTSANLKLNVDIQPNDFCKIASQSRVFLPCSRLNCIHCNKRQGQSDRGQRSSCRRQMRGGYSYSGETFRAHPREGQPNVRKPPRMRLLVKWQNRNNQLFWKTGRQVSVGKEVETS